MLHQLSYEASWEQVIIWVDYNSIKCFHYKHIICGLMKTQHYDLHPIGLTAQLVEHCTGIAEVRVQISIQAFLLLFLLLLKEARKGFFVAIVFVKR